MRDSVLVKIGRLIIKEFEATPTQMCTCVLCNQERVTSYIPTWCDECAFAGGYLPRDYAELETKVLFRLFMNLILRESGGDWLKVKAFVNAWNCDKTMVTGTTNYSRLTGLLQAPDEIYGNCTECGNAIMHRKYGRYCSEKCYQANYRRVNKEKLQRQRRERNQAGKNTK